jgi:predicted transcriptional regulator
MSSEPQLSRRERQIMDVVYQLGEATTNDVLKELADPPSRTAVRTFLRILEEKGHLTHRSVGREFCYQPRQSVGTAGRSAVKRVLQTFFGGSIEKAVAIYLSDPQTDIPAEELKRLESLIREARKRGR